MSAKEKKEWEAKQKEKAEAKAAAEAAKAEAEGEQGEGEEEEKEPEPTGPPEVTSQEVDTFKEKLAKCGDIYVNDALQQSLTTSNTVTELRCGLRVMGCRMTEEVRKLGKFFLYEQTPTVAVLGGQLNDFNI